MTLPTDAAARKAAPVFSGVLRYFPDALIAVAECSRAGNEQHNPGEPLHWAKEKSTDEADALVRHLLESGTMDTDGIRHSAKVAWRALALLQREIEAEEKKRSGFNGGTATITFDGKIIGTSIGTSTLRGVFSDLKMDPPEFDMTIGPNSESVNTVGTYSAEREARCASEGESETPWRNG